MSDAREPVRALILFGPPGSGKGTQAKLIQDCLRIPHISTGDMLRDRMRHSDDLGEVIRRLVDNGDLVTDELVNQMVDERIGQADCAAGFILDGYPRTLSQAGAICQRLAEQSIAWLVVHLKVDYNVIIRRLAGRRHCLECGAVFNLESNPPKAAGVCDVCGNPLTVREDDREQVVRKRLESYDARTRPLLEFFSAEGSAFYEVDGADAPPPQIAMRICELIRNTNGE